MSDMRNPPEKKKIRIKIRRERLKCYANACRVVRTQKCCISRTNDAAKSPAKVKGNLCMLKLIRKRTGSFSRAFTARHVRCIENALSFALSLKKIRVSKVDADAARETRFGKRDLARGSTFD